MFTEEQKAVFSFTWRGKTTFVDPLLMLWELDNLAGGSLQELLVKVNSPEYGIAAPAMQRLAYAVCIGFKLGQPFNPETGQGVQYGDWIDVLNGFTTWMESKKKTGSDSPPCSGPTEGE